jgi:hypothetical protein
VCHIKDDGEVRPQAVSRHASPVAADFFLHCI